MVDRTRANVGAGLGGPDSTPQLARLDLVDARRKIATKCDVKGTFADQKRCHGWTERGHKKENQDTFVIIPNFCGQSSQGLVGVFDGHGGAGAHISMWVRQNLPKYLEEEYTVKKQAPREALINAFNRTHAELDRKTQPVPTRRRQLPSVPSARALLALRSYIAAARHHHHPPLLACLLTCRTDVPTQ